jgi:hypothetical protein
MEFLAGSSEQSIEPATLISHFDGVLPRFSDFHHGHRVRFDGMRSTH